MRRLDQLMLLLRLPQSRPKSSSGLSAESLAKARLDVIEGEMVEEVRGRARRSELKIRITLWSYTTLTDVTGSAEGHC
jgi:hypothetical protein